MNLSPLDLHLLHLIRPQDANATLNLRLQPPRRKGDERRGTRAAALLASSPYDGA
jgi:hypothetical protein